MYQELRASGLLNEICNGQGIIRKYQLVSARYFGFCLNERCHPEKNKYYINGGYLGRIETSDKGQGLCSLCEHALYWSNNYEDNYER